MSYLKKLRENWANADVFSGKVKFLNTAYEDQS